MSVRKKGNKWYARFQIDGIRYERTCKGATTQKDAEKCEAILKAEIMHGNYNFGVSEILPKFKDALNIMQEYSKNNKLSYKSDVCRLNKIKEFFGENTPLKEITPNKIEKFKSYLLNIGSAKATVNRYIALLKKMFNLAIKNKLIKENPCNGVVLIREDNFKIRFLTKEEEKELFAKISDQELKNIVKIALYTGMRKSEIFNLKWENVSDKYIEILESKSGKKRKIPNAGNLKILIEKIKKENEYIFFNRKTNLPYKDISERFNNALINANIKNFRFHDLRHTAATRMVDSGIDLVVIKEILGHSNIQTTMRYAHALESVKIKAIELLSSY